MRKFAFLTIVLSLPLLFATFAAAQQGDVMLGFGTVMSPGAEACNFNTGCPEKGGLYPNIGADVVFHKRVGFGFDVAWRGSQGSYGGTGGIPYRPIIFNFDGIYQPRISKKAGVDLMGGIGWQSTRFYSGSYTCNYFNCINYTSSNHFLVHLGGGLRYYFWHHVFIRPEAHYYWINNNTNDFTSNNILRVGASIGYTISPD